jgi:hypothetical protein
MSRLAGSSKDIGTKRAGDRQPNTERTWEVLGMAAETAWFYEDELSRLRWEWVDALRDYGRGGSPAQLQRLERARDAYVGRAKRLRADAYLPGQQDRTADRAARVLLHTY